jgi:hypothetical protein
LAIILSAAKPDGFQTTYGGTEVPPLQSNNLN